MAYLYASASIQVRYMHGIGPTALALLADTVTRHLVQRERFTVHLDGWYPPKSRHFRWMNDKENDRTVKSLEDTVRNRFPGPFGIDVVQTAKSNLLIRFVPHDEWHPEPAAAPGPPVLATSDASYRGPHHARAGIAVNGTATTIDLAPAGHIDSNGYEFLAVCLALLTAVGERSPLTVRSDSTEAVREGRFLREGQMPSWVYRHGNEVVQRVAASAMSASRLRPVRIEHVPRENVAAAHYAAFSAAGECPMAMRSWATRQGMPLSWVDAQRGLDSRAPSKPAFVERRTVIAAGPIWA
ncbi:hypothetical protein EV284_6414 [Streptomyces sp. BK022]|uniref:hypothetical protein n=1 Tax=Streptomyces sp. BK022 TaxID=2512123 RepID=UPI0010297C2F|nr:hypothetical protein [Streptomyces sp. BK022]RZU28248.1 hypothetical protein EV284_6414 [Streptomyces sp. BK022]